MDQRLSDRNDDAYARFIAQKVSLLSVESRMALETLLMHLLRVEGKLTPEATTPRN